MSGAVGEKKRLIRITDGNVRQNHLYVAEHLDFFSPDIVGPPKLEGELNGRGIKIYLEGLDETVKTDIGSERKNGQPRRMFRQRAWVGRFFHHHKLKGGDLLALERIADRKYRLYPYGTNSDRDHGWPHLIQQRFVF